VFDIHAFALPSRPRSRDSSAAFGFVGKEIFNREPKSDGFRSEVLNWDVLVAQAEPWALMAKKRK